MSPNTCYMPSHSLVLLYLIRINLFFKTAERLHNSNSSNNNNEPESNTIYDLLNISNIERHTSCRLRRTVQKTNSHHKYGSPQKYLCILWSIFWGNLLTDDVTSKKREKKKRNEILNQKTSHPHTLLISILRSSKMSFLSLYLLKLCVHFYFIMWHRDPLLDNDREISNYTTAVAK
jgi:hypothetical protein